jgi:hypothetical protein
MPIQSWAHSKFWRAKANIPVVRPPSLGGYPHWQAGVLMGSLLGACQYWYERARYVLAWAVVAWSWSPDQARAMAAALDCVSLEAWTAARESVRQTAQTIGFNEPQHISHLGQLLKAGGLGMAENHWRHLLAVTLLGGLTTRDPLTNPEKNLLIELAYWDYARTPKAEIFARLR